MTIDYKYVLNSFLKIVWSISDRHCQQRVWIKGVNHESNDYDETVNFFFDLGDPILEKYKEYGLTDDQYVILRRFRNHFEVFTDQNYYAPEFVDTPEWKKIMDEAKEVLAAFNYQTSDQNSPSNIIC